MDEPFDDREVATNRGKDEGGAADIIGFGRPAAVLQQELHD